MHHGWTEESAATAVHDVHRCPGAVVVAARVDALQPDSRFLPGQLTAIQSWLFLRPTPEAWRRGRHAAHAAQVLLLATPQQLASAQATPWPRGAKVSHVQS